MSSHALPSSATSPKEEAEDSYNIPNPLLSSDPRRKTPQKTKRVKKPPAAQLSFVLPRPTERPPSPQATPDVLLAALPLILQEALNSTSPQTTANVKSNVNATTPPTVVSLIATSPTQNQYEPENDLKSPTQGSQRSLDTRISRITRSTRHSQDSQDSGHSRSSSSASASASGSASGTQSDLDSCKSASILHPGASRSNALTAFSAFTGVFSPPMSQQNGASEPRYARNPKHLHARRNSVSVSMDLYSKFPEYDANEVVYQQVSTQHSASKTKFENFFFFILGKM